MRSLIRRLRTRLAPGDGEPTDERLLDDFLAHRAVPQVADDAFAAIVRRHGPMVRGVCRRVLRNDTDADDAFQAVFVVLLRKAEAVRPRDRLGNWLYGVAVNVARRGRDTAARRRTQELTADVPDREPANTDLREVLDQELSALPDAYRAAVVACDLEGHTRSEAAGRLGWSEGTVASRLARGRAILADRLTRRRIALPAAGLAVVFGTNTASAVPVVISSTLFANPSPAAEVLAAEVMRTMTTSKLQTVAVALFAALGVVGVGAATVWACGGYGPRSAPPVSAAKPYPFESVETTEPRTGNAQAAWARSAPTANVGSDKPAGENAGAAKAALFVLKNPAGDITVVSDRHETFVEFFRRQPVLVAVVPPAQRNRMLYEAKGVTDFEFVEKASFNVDGPRVATYGTSVKLAPVAFDGPVMQLLDVAADTAPVVFVRDAADKNVWHAAGVTRRSSVGFFAAKERVKPDEFAPADLLQTIEKK